MNTKKSSELDIETGSFIPIKNNRDDNNRVGINLMSNFRKT